METIGFLKQNRNHLEDNTTIFDQKSEEKIRLKDIQINQVSSK